MAEHDEERRAAAVASGPMRAGVPGEGAEDSVPSRDDASVVMGAPASRPVDPDACVAVSAPITEPRRDDSHAHAAAPAPAPRPVDPCVRAENEDDDGYDPYSDRRPSPEPLFERDPWA